MNSEPTLIAVSELPVLHYRTGELYGKITGVYPLRINKKLALFMSKQNDFGYLNLRNLIAWEENIRFLSGFDKVSIRFLYQKAIETSRTKETEGILKLLIRKEGGGKELRIKNYEK